MSSSVFYRFKNSKEPSRITFDGTSLSVFEIKRAIILEVAGSQGGDDFDLHIYPEDQPSSEFTDDTETIPRSSTVIAVRRPAARGHGKAARYLTGRAPVRAIKKTQPQTAQPSSTPQTEQDAEAAFLAESAAVWDQQKQSLSQAKPVAHKPGNMKKPQAKAPDHDPPPGYVCYRCHQAGHWIQSMAYYYYLA
jgi:protein MPE1